MKTTMKHSLMFCLIVTGLNTAVAGDWTQWRGPDANGISPETGWSPEALGNKSRVLWEINVGAGHSAVAAKGNRLYTMGEKLTVSGGDSILNEIVYCIDNRNGHTIWQHSTPSEHVNYPGPRSTPVLDGTSLYTLGTQGNLFCFNAENGKIIWQKHLVKEGLSQKPDWGFSGSPVVESNKLLLNAGKSGLALEKNSGKVIWKSEPEKCGLASPILITVGNKRIAVTSGEKHFYGVDVQTGKRLWEFAWESYNDPVVIDTDIYFSGETRGNTLVNIDANKPTAKWENKNMVDGFQNCVAIGGYIYGQGDIRRRTHLQCVKLETGELMWSENLGMYGALTAADGKLIMLTGDGRLVAAQATPNGYSEIAGSNPLTMADNTGAPRNEHNYCWTAPVLSNGKIYIRNNFGDLACMNVSP